MSQFETDLEDFNMSLGEMLGEIKKLIQRYGRNARIYSDAGYNNVSVYVETDD